MNTINLFTLVNEGLELDKIIKLFQNTEDSFNRENFYNFLEKYLEDSKKFEEETGIPKKYYKFILNLATFQKCIFFGYTQINDIYIYINCDYEAVFIKDKKEILKYKNFKENWLLTELDKLFGVNDIIDNDIFIECPQLFISKNFNIINVKNIYVRYYFDMLYDIVFKHNNDFHCFYSYDKIDEFSFNKFNINENEILRMKRMLKINKIELNDFLETNNLKL